MMHLATAIAAMQLIDRGCINGDMAANGILEAEYELVTQETPWRGDQRNAVERVLHTLIYGTMDNAAIPRVRPPAEYIAAVISVFVSGANYMPACQWLGQFEPAEDLADGTVYTPATAEQLFAMCVQLEHQTGNIKSRFEKTMGTAIKKAAKP